MLITNFSAGELSKNLFGRTDLPQYYSAASRLENFDVIPTGGIKRRSGTRQILPMESKGRLIPFVTDRNTHLLLYLTPGKIQAIENGQVKKTVTSTAALPLYQTLDEINEVQHAQNFDTMILVHENYKPLMINYQKDNSGLILKLFEIKTDVEIKTDKGLSAFLFNEQDKVYEGEKYLTEEKNYPKAVTFFNGRLFFSGTIKNRQRIFASKVNNINLFSTYKKYVTQKKTYICIYGSVNPDNTAEIELGVAQALNFTASLSDYFIASSFYDDDTRISSMIGNLLTLTKGSNTQIGVTSEIKQVLIGLINKFNYYNTNIVETTILSFNFFRLGWYSGTITCKLYYGASIAYIKAYATYQDTASGTTITNSPVKIAPENTSAPYTLDCSVDRYAASYITQYENYLLDRIQAFTNGTVYGLGNQVCTIDLINRSLVQFPGSQVRPDGYDPNNVKPSYDNYQYEVYNENITNAVSGWKARIFETMRYFYRDNWFYGFANQIETDILARYDHLKDVYIPFYTKEIIEDRYPTPDDGFTFEIASDKNDAIRWLALNKGVIVGTEMAEWILPPGINATNIQAQLNSRYGSDSIQGTAVNDATCFFQAGKKSLVEYYIPQQDNNFRANNMALLCPEMLSESPAVEFDYITSPYTKLFITREKGDIAALLYERGTGTFAWGRITTSGRILSVAVQPGADGNDDVYMAVERNGRVFLEVLREAGEVYLDGWRSWDGDTEGYDPATAVVWDEKARKTYSLKTPLAEPLPPPADAENPRWIGCPYKSVMRTMPVLANNQMKKQRIVNIIFRFLNSFLPKLTAIDGGKPRGTDTIGEKPPFSGVKKVPNPGGWDEDVQVELTHEEPTPVTVLAMNAETQG